MERKQRFGWFWSIRENTIDENIIHEVFTDASYDLSFVENPEEVRTIVDIGSHIGSFIVKAKKHFIKARVQGYEVDEDNYNLCVSNIQGLLNVNVENVAVYGYRKPTVIPTSKGLVNTGSVILQYQECGEIIYPEGYEPKIKNISEITNGLPIIDVLKIDCEGGEHSIFQDLDFSRIRYMYCELHSYSNEIGMDETVEFLLESGMKILWIQKCNESIYNLIMKNERL